MLRLKDGTIVPGATTIVGQLDKTFLVKWANKLGKEGKDVEEYTKQKARLGTLIHNIIQSHLLQRELDISAYSDDELSCGDKAYFRYLEWEKQHTIEEVEIEKELVSELYKYGGYLDLYCKLDGKYTVIDIKTSKNISIDQEIQVSSYAQLLMENNLPIDKIMILNLGKEDNSKLQVKEISKSDMVKYFKMFIKLLDVYYTKKEIGWN